LFGGHFAGRGRPKPDLNLYRNASVPLSKGEGRIMRRLGDAAPARSAWTDEAYLPLIHINVGPRWADIIFKIVNM
jgi:hypothetical protein